MGHTGHGVAALVSCVLCVDECDCCGPLQDTSPQLRSQSPDELDGADEY